MKIFDLLKPQASIRSKLVYLIFFLLLVITCLIFLVVFNQQGKLLKTQWGETMAAQARLLANSSQAAVEFGDRREMARLLTSLEINPAIWRARASLANGKVLGEYKPYAKAPAFPVGEERLLFLDEVLVIREPILRSEREAPIGHIELLVSLEQFHAMETRTIIETGSVLLIAMLIVLGLTRWGIVSLTEPLEKLDQLAQRISRDASLDERLGMTRNDEIGSLGRSFDRMLDTLQSRDRELASYRDSLESMVENRTQELKQAIKEAQEANRTKSDFLARMSHEIRTPLNAIVGLTHLALENAKDATQGEHLQQVLKSSENLLAIINDILDYSKVEAGRLTLEARPFAPIGLLQSLNGMFSARAHSRGIELRIDADQAIPPMLVGDSLRLTQILTNLVSNAVKFTERGEVRIEAKLEEVRNESVALLSFKVSDTGIGITSAQMSELFAPFAQGDSSITRRFGGTGLGLAICKQLAELMGGEISVSSTPGQGSIFCLRVPLSLPTKAALRRALPRTAVKLEKLDKLPRWNGEKILLVEDVALNRTVAVALLKKVGLSVKTANNGIEALKLLGEESFALVLMDLQMPEMDGLTATRVIRDDVRLAHLPVIAMTAHAGEEDRKQTEAAGMNAHLTKPIIPGELYEMLAHWLPPQES